jgi:hypothetical protein
MCNLHHLWPNLQTRKKDFECNYCKAIFKGFFIPFLFQPLINGKYIPILWFVTFYCLDMAPKIHNNSKLSKEQDMFANWAVDGAHYAFHKNWLDYQNFSNLRISKAPSKKNLTCILTS